MNSPKAYCLFCEIVKRKKEAYIIAESKENEGMIAILDVFPVSDGHTLIITKQHFNNLAEVEEESWKYFLPLLKIVINKLQVAFQPSGFNIISNMNEIASQSVFHLHIHIIPKYEKEQGFIWTARPQLKYNLEAVAQKLK